MDLTAIAIVAVGFLLFSLVTERLAGSFLTGPLVFSAFGFVVGPFVLGVVPMEMTHDVLHTLAEVTLVLVLFSDAANTDLAQLRRDHNLPIRMLLMGMPLTVLLGTVAAAIFFDELSLWGAALLAAILAPTDAALGQAVVTNPRVPVRIRQALDIESGMNDGIALPLVLIFASLASTDPVSANVGGLVLSGILQVTTGPIVGVAVGYLGARAVRFAHQKGWMREQSEGIVAMAVAFLAFSLAGLVYGNGFLAAFVAGLTFGNVLAQKCKFLYEFTEAEGSFLVLITFFIFGGVMLPEALLAIRPIFIGFAALSLTLLRMLPVWLSLMGTGVRTATNGFLGWFGPRGLASILFVLLIVEGAEVRGSETIFSAVMVTVMLSIVLHGITAGPASRWYAEQVSRMGECEEAKPVSDEPFTNMAT